MFSICFDKGVFTALLCQGALLLPIERHCNFHALWPSGKHDLHSESYLVLLGEGILRKHECGKACCWGADVLAVPYRQPQKRAWIWQ